MLLLKPAKNCIDISRIQKKKKLILNFLIFFFLHFSRVTIVLLRWITMVVLKDLDTKIKHRLKKLRMQVAVSKTKRDDKTHQD